MTNFNKYAQKADRLLDNTGDSSPPVDLERIAAHLHLEIKEVPLEEEYSGFLAVHEKIIAVNSAHPPVRRRFTIAHEIGHYVLHRRNQSSPVFIDRVIYRRHEASPLSNYNEEMQANAFAAALLMPEKWLDEYMENHPLNLSKTGDIKILADEFGVSRKAMEYRLHNLGFVIAT